MRSEATRSPPVELEVRCAEAGCDRAAGFGDARCVLHAARLGSIPRQLDAIELAPTAATSPAAGSTEISPRGASWASEAAVSLFWNFLCWVCAIATKVLTFSRFGVGDNELLTLGVMGLGAVSALASPFWAVGASRLAKTPTTRGLSIALTVVAWTPATLVGLALNLAFVAISADLLADLVVRLAR